MDYEEGMLPGRSEKAGYSRHREQHEQRLGGDDVLFFSHVLFLEGRKFY